MNGWVSKCSLHARTPSNNTWNLEVHSLNHTFPVFKFLHFTNRAAESKSGGGGGGGGQRTHTMIGIHNSKAVLTAAFRAFLFVKDSIMKSKFTCFANS